MAEVLPQKVTNRSRNLRPFIGAQVLESLTSGMYDNPLMIYREYVQNSVDAIDVAVATGRMKAGTGRVNILISGKDRSVTVFTPGGRRVARLERKGQKWDLNRPTDIAVDPAGYFYVLDERQPQVVVFDPSYRFVTLLTAQNLGGGVLKKPISLDVDGSGDIYVYDDDADALMRFH